MFYCKDCATKNKWPEGLTYSIGRCEICEKQAYCYDVASKHLPPVPHTYTAVVCARQGTEIISEIQVGQPSDRLGIEKLIELAPTLYAFRAARDFLVRHHMHQNIIITTEMKIK